MLLMPIMYASIELSAVLLTLHDDVVVLKGAFVQSIIFEREAPQFLSGAELSEFELLTVLCTK